MNRINRPLVVLLAAAAIAFSGRALAQAAQPQAPAPTPAPPATQPPASPASTEDRRPVFDMGEIVVIGTAEGLAGLARSTVTKDQLWRFDRGSLEQAVNVLPGVVSTMDSNNRRNESDIFVRGFDRWQVPLMIDGVRIYLPADNRLDFGRFVTADVAEVQIQKGYASVIDGPGAMGGAINLVSRVPVKAFEVEGSASISDRDDRESWNSYLSLGTRQRKYYAQGSLSNADRDFWSLSAKYKPTATSLQPGGRRTSSDSADSRINAKFGFTPNTTDEYTLNFTQQNGEKGAPLNVYNNPPVPANGFWRWPYWDIQNTVFLSRTQLGAAYVKTKIYYNTFKNGLDAYDDATYTTQSAANRFSSPYDDHTAGLSLETGTTHYSNHTLRAALHYRGDVHKEQQTTRPTNPTLRFVEPVQTQSLKSWSVAVEDTLRLAERVSLVGGFSYDRQKVTKAEEFNAALGGLFEFPRGGTNSFNSQAGVMWRVGDRDTLHFSVSDRARFPMIFELYSARMGTATPNPNLGPERATNVEVGWTSDALAHVHVEAAGFYSNVHDMIQSVILPDATGQYQNVGNGRFAGAEAGATVRPGSRLEAGANYTYINREIHDALLPNLRPTGVPTHKAFLYATWRPTGAFSLTPSVDVAGDRWSDINPAPVPASPYVRTGAYRLVNISATYKIIKGLELVGGFKNATDDDYELSWGLPQPGRTFFLKTRVTY